MYWLRSSVGSDLLSLTANRSRSVLAVKGSLRRFAPWTACGDPHPDDSGVKLLARLLRCATTLRVTAPLGYGSRRLV